MNRSRIATLFCLAILVLTLGATALAQDVLPMPSPAIETKGGAAILTYAPLSYGEISAMSPMLWSQVGGATKYKLSFKLEDGSVVKWNAPFMCSPTCMNMAYPMPLFDAVRDGALVQWRVTAKVAGMKYQSAWSPAYVNEVDPSNPIFPANHAVMDRQDVTYFMWHLEDIDVKNTLVVKRVSDGKTVLKHTIDMSESCNTMEDFCGASFMNIGDPRDFFKAGTEYKWFVKSKGVSGEKSKSQVFRFTTMAKKK